MYKKYDSRYYIMNDLDDDYVFNSKGEFTGEIRPRPGKPHRLVLQDSKGKEKSYIFADQINDPENVGYASKAIPVSKGEMITQMVKRGALSDYNRGRENKPLWFAKNSTDEEKFDYTKSYLKDTYKKSLRNPDNDTYTFDWSIQNRGYQPKPDELGFADNVFFLPEGDGYAHNTLNFGNYLWSASGRALGFTEKELKTGANWHNKYYLFSGDLGNDDSPDDQFSISRGVKFANKYDLMNKTWDGKNKRFVPSKPIINKIEYPKYGRPKW